ncbi:MAG TPA: hypothetical protein VGH63_14040 [Polyangia bacterium]
MTPTRAQLRALATELRNARTRLLPMDVAERMQHVIVQLENLVVSPTIDPTAIDAAYEAAQALLRECDQLAGKS